jgi:hypothetical protein
MLNHSGVVQLMGICMNIPELYLVTELVVGGSLEDLLHIEKRKLSSQVLPSSPTRTHQAGGVPGFVRAGWHEGCACVDVAQGCADG